MIILGLNAYHADASAAIIADGKLITAAEEERFNRIKHSAGFPKEALKYCLTAAGISVKDLDYIAVPKNPKARILKKICYGIKIPALALKRLYALRKISGIKKDISEIFEIDEKQIPARILNVEHHMAHIASSFFVSGLDKAALFSADGLGDFASTVWGVGEGNKIKLSGETVFPHSLGIYYSAVTQHLGFHDYGDEYKVMGLSAYGQELYRNEFKKILINNGAMSFKLGLDYFLHHRKSIGLNFLEGYPCLDALYSPYLEKLLGKARRETESIEIRHQNIAASLQSRLEDVIFSLLNNLYEYNERNRCRRLNRLCISGGVGFNCVANGRLFNNTPFETVYICPAPGDAGLAIGAAYYLWHAILNKPREFVMEHPYWGPQYGHEEITIGLKLMDAELKRQKCKIIEMGGEDRICKNAASEIAQGKIVGWFQGRMEWGPRALGNRSILADPRNPGIKDILNYRIKHRESFRPFSPSVLQEDMEDFFESFKPSPFMLFAYKVKKEKAGLIPAVVHIDGTARVQTVEKDKNPLYWKLIKEFKNITGIPVLLNTSFNENEPIVCTVKDALNCFLRVKIDILVLGKYWIERNAV